MSIVLMRLWNWLPAVVRGLIANEIIVSLGALIPGFAVILNLKTSPRVPWMVIVTTGWLWFFWWYLSGHGWPRSTADARRRDLRGGPLTRRRWIWALVAGVLGIASTIALAFATARLANLPRDAFASPINLANYPMLTVLCAIACISATAGVVEEAGFRGFLISPIQRRHGWTVAILVSGIMFWLDHHLSHGYATIAFLPFFIAISVVHGLLVKYSGSIRPSAVLHAIADFIVIPTTYGLVGTFVITPLSQTGFDRQFGICLGVMLICAVAFVPALKQLGVAPSDTTQG
jgi:membrane protease YdiL (CAAX protease family)